MKNYISSVLLIITLLGCNGQANKQSADQTILDSVNEFMNRPVYKELTAKIIDSLPDESLEQAVIDNIFEIIGDDYENQYSIVQRLTKGQQAMYTVWWVEAEVNNGGFNQFYFNSSGQFAEMAVDGFKLFEAKKFANLMRRANKIYKENEKRLEQFNDGTIESFSESYKDNPLNDLDEEFYQLYYDEAIIDLKIKYIRDNPLQFTQR